jgi:hypothetical protein
MGLVIIHYLFIMHLFFGGAKLVSLMEYDGIHLPCSF